MHREMAPDPPDESSSPEVERPRLLGLAYRLTGSRSEAEDLVQEAYTRLAAADGIDNPAGWLTTVTTRLAVDHLRSARVQRERYIGPWLPEPVDESFTPEEDLARAESVSTALLVVMESMSPLERAAFVLHDVFGYGFEEVAAMLDRTPVSVRQAAARGRQHVQARRPRFEPDPDARREVGERFLAAARGEDLDALMALLSPDVVFRSDGGGVVVAARKELRGAERVARFLLALRDNGDPRARIELRWVNASPAMAILLPPDDSHPAEHLLGVMVLHIGDDHQVAEVNSVLNPSKLAHIH